MPRSARPSIRWFATVAASLLLLLSRPGSTAPELPVLEARSVAPGVFAFIGSPGVASPENRGFNSNAGFVVTAEGVVVIDALGTPPLGEAMVRAIRKVTDRPIKHVVITHYHADHFYGLPALKSAGAQIWAHRSAAAYLESGEGAARLKQRQADLRPWVNEKTTLVAPDRWLEGDGSFTLGGVRFDLIFMGPAHAPDDLIVVVGDSGVVFSGDILFTGRIPFVGEADSKRWLDTFGRLLALKPKVMITGHGEPSRNPAADLVMTRDYLLYLRSAMGKAVEDFVPFDEAYAKTDWSKFAGMPAFTAANRINAYGTYLLMEKESLARK